MQASNEVSLEARLSVSSLYGRPQVKVYESTTGPEMTEQRLLGSTIETKYVKQPETRPITQQQLINEVKGIYAGPVMVERKCVDIINQQTQPPKRLSSQQFTALVALHRTLLQEHHDFFSANQHPSASDNLKNLAVKYAMPARMWRHGIHAFLELLRHLLPDSMDHMLSFIYLAYSMIPLLKESVPSFEETWIECLGDLARYNRALYTTNDVSEQIRNSGQYDLGETKVPAESFLVNYDRLQAGAAEAIFAMQLNFQYFRRKLQSLLLLLSSILGGYSRMSVAIVAIMLSENLPRVSAEVNKNESDLELLGDSRLTDNTQFAQKVLLWMLYVMIISLVFWLGPKLRLRNAIETSITIAFMSALLRAVTTNQDFPTLWAVLNSGLSLGSSFWLARITISDKNTTFVHLVRYLIPAYLIYQYLCMLDPASHNGDLKLSTIFPDLSIFGSVCVNALVNEKIREVKEAWTDVEARILAFSGLTWVHPDGDEIV